MTDNSWSYSRNICNPLHIKYIGKCTTSYFCFWFVFWTVVAVHWPSRRLHRRRLFFYPLAGTEHGSQPSLTTRDRELVSVLEVRIEPVDLNPGPLTPQSVTTNSTTGWWCYPVVFSLKFSTTDVSNLYDVIYFLNSNLHFWFIYKPQHDITLFFFSF